MRFYSKGLFCGEGRGREHGQDQSTTIQAPIVGPLQSCRCAPPRVDQGEGVPQLEPRALSTHREVLFLLGIELMSPHPGSVTMGPGCSSQGHRRERGSWQLSQDLKVCLGGMGR